mmetsp:Transcript_20575/g.30193  ORF Transcript_20575/g.30193 Transcript_20575/m.30193 type:complete len:112 (+) Transcript_20575:58-393(+)
MHFGETFVDESICHDHSEGENGEFIYFRFNIFMLLLLNLPSKTALKCPTSRWHILVYYFNQNRRSDKYNYRKRKQKYLLLKRHRPEKRVGSHILFGEKNVTIKTTLYIQFI